jgi:hypothetical protein
MKLTTVAVVSATLLTALAFASVTPVLALPGLCGAAITGAVGTFAHMFS